MINTENGFLKFQLKWLYLYSTDMAKKVCPRLRDLVTAPAGEITQPRTNFLANSVGVVIESQNLRPVMSLF